MGNILIAFNKFTQVGTICNILLPDDLEILFAISLKTKGQLYTFFIFRMF